VFLDRDGVINEKAETGEYITSCREFRLLPGAAAAIRLLNEAGVRVVAVTNQRGVARGIMTTEDLEEIHRKMADDLRRQGAHLDAVYYCPHEDGSCDCRKPAVGLFLQAQADFPDIIFDEAFVIGDSDRDMEAGRRLGARLIRIGQTMALDEASAPSLFEAVKGYLLAGDLKPAG